MIKLLLGNLEECPNPLLLPNATYQLMLSLLIPQKNTYLTSKRKNNGSRLTMKINRQASSLRNLMLYAKYRFIQT